jgi:tetratricopeptide (TPR) repeat protein
MTRRSVADQHALLQRAANCYLKAGELDEAGRVFELLGEFRQAARCHEQRQRFAEAAELYEKDDDWPDAARCYFAAGHYDTAAIVYERAGELLSAAWIWAEHAHRYEHTRTLLRTLQAQAQTHVADIAVVAARCDAGTHAHATAVRALRALLDDVRAATAIPHVVAARVLRRCEAIATTLRRPDLHQMVMATAVARGMAGAERQWETWALDTLRQPIYTGAASIDEPSTDSETARPRS